jgi:hypothetical protein
MKIDFVTCSKCSEKSWEFRIVFSLTSKSSRKTLKNIDIHPNGSQCQTKRREDLGPDCPLTVPQMEKGFLRRRGKTMPGTSTMGH